MRARKYNKKVELWVVSPSGDGYGGNPITTQVLLTSSWCHISTPTTNSRSTDFGVIDFSDTIIVQLRKRIDIDYNGLNQYFKYRGDKYIIQGQPVNLGFEDREIQITLKRASKKGV